MGIAYKIKYGDLTNTLSIEGRDVIRVDDFRNPPRTQYSKLP